MWKILCSSINDEIRSEIEKLGHGTSFYEIKCVSNIDELFLTAVVERFDAYIVDADMRYESMADICRAIRVADEKGKIVCLSTSDSSRSIALDAGADVFLKLPDEFHLLRLKIEDLFDEA